MKKKTEQQVRIFLIIILIACLVYCSVQFTLSWHNMDLIHNMQIMTNQINEAGFRDLNNNSVYIPFDKITDTADDFVSRPLENYYISSSNNLRYYFLSGLFLAGALGTVIGGLK